MDGNHSQVIAHQMPFMLLNNMQLLEQTMVANGFQENYT